MADLEPNTSRRAEAADLFYPGQSRENALSLWRVFPFPLARIWRFRRLIRIIGVSLALLIMCTLFLTLFHQVLPPGVGQQSQSNVQGMDDPATNLPTSNPMSADPQIQVSSIDDLVYVLTPDGTLRTWNMSDQTVVWQRKTLALPEHALLAGKHRIFSLVWNSQGGWIEAWSAEDGTRLWGRPVPVPGYEPLMLSGDNLYVNTVNGTIFALRIDDGAQLWSFETSISRPFHLALFATPIVVAVLARDGSISVIRARDGVQIYQYQSTHHSLFPYPLIEDGNIYIQTGTTIQALRVYDGADLWTFPLQEHELFLPMVISNEVLYVGDTAGQLTALSASNGTSLWKHQMKKGLFSEPIVLADRLYLIQQDGSLWARRASDATLLWHTPPGRVLGQVFATADMLYLNLDLPGQQIYALRASDGAEIWHHAITTLQTRHWVPLIVNNILLFGPDDFTLHAWNGYSGQFLWKYRAPAQLCWQPSFDADHLYVTQQDGGISMLRSETGTLLWRWQYGHATGEK